MTLPLSDPQPQEDYSFTDAEENSYPSFSIYPPPKGSSSLSRSSFSSNHSDDTEEPSTTVYPEPESTQMEEQRNMPPEIRIQPPRRSATISLDAPVKASDEVPELSIYPATPAHSQPLEQLIGADDVERSTTHSLPLLGARDDMSPLLNTPSNPYKARGLLFPIKSKKGAIDGYSIYSSSSTLLNLSSETLNTLASERKINDFLTSDEDLTEDEGRSHLNPQLRRRASLPSIMSTDSVVSNSATLPLRDFCELICRCRSLERARIVSVECHKEKATPKHRFLMFHCVRGSKPPVWFRVDRRINGGVSKLFFNRGTVNANDTVRIAVDKADLLGITPADQENELTFITHPNLGAFRFFLDIICQELTKYAIWPENCWFLCSVLQEHLRKASYGKYALGTAVVQDIAPEIRSRIDVRAYHEPEPLPRTDKLLDLIIQEHSLGHMAASIFKNIMKLAGKAPQFPPQRGDLLNPVQVKKLADALHEFAKLSHFLGPSVLCLLSARSVGVYRHLYRHNPEEFYSGFFESLLAYAPRLRACGRDDEALYCYKEALDAQRDQYKRDPEAYRFILLASLNEHADRLSAAGRLSDACTVHLEIVKVYRAFYDRHPPEANHFTLAGHRRSYISRLMKAGRLEDACAEELEIVKMARVLRKSNPSDYNWVLADCLHVYAGRLTSLSQLEEACLALAEAVELQRVQYKEDPNEQTAPLLASLAKYRDALSRAERGDDMQFVDREVLDIHRQAFVRDPRTHLKTVAEALRAHSDRLSGMGLQNDVFEIEQELVGMHRRVYEMEPDAHHEVFSKAVSDYADWLAAANRIPEARDALLEIVQLHRKLFESDRHRHHDRLAAFLEVYFNRLTDFGIIQEAADVAKEVLTMYHNLWKEDPSVYFKLVLNAVAMYDTALNSAGYKGEGASILVDVHRARYRNTPEMKNARALAEHLATYAQRMDEAARWQDACDAALQLVDILEKHPLPPQSAEVMHRTQQLHACSIHVAKARHFQQALSIADLAMQSARDVEETDASSAWVQRWRPKTMHTHKDIKRVVAVKKPTSQILEAQKLRLTYRDNKSVDVERAHPPVWAMAALAISIVAVFVAGYLARR